MHTLSLYIIPPSSNSYASPVFKKFSISSITYGDAQSIIPTTFIPFLSAHSFAMFAKFKKDILEKVIVLSEAQNGILAAAEFDEKAFRENIDEKAELIDKIERLDDGFNSLFARVKETLDGHKDEYKSEITDIKELIKSVTELAVRVQAQEARNKVLAENRFAQMRKEVSNAKRNTQAASTYYNSMNKLNFEPHLMDQKK